jgi:D-alanine-D-alanine ligase
MLVCQRDFERHRAAVLERIHSLGPKTVIKPNRLGSSVATFIIEDSAQTEHALLEAFRLGQDAIVEEFIEGVEITAPVLGNGEPEALPLIEIVPNLGKFYDYQSKYADGGSDHIIPARLSDQLTACIQQQAVDVHLCLGCRGVTRSDFIVRDQEAYFLEINTIPGMTAVSLAPQSAQVAGYSFSRFLDKLIELALEGKQN